MGYINENGGNMTVNVAEKCKRQCFFNTMQLQYARINHLATREQEVRKRLSIIAEQGIVENMQITLLNGEKVKVLSVMSDGYLVIEGCRKLDPNKLL